MISRGEDPFGHPLWPQGATPHWIPMPHRSWHNHGPGWAFRADWYEGHLTGHPLDLDLLEKVALIPPEEWEKGDEHLNDLIAWMYDGYLVAKKAAHLEADFIAEIGFTRGPGHNNPPGPIEDLPLIVPQIQEPLRAIRNQALAPRPDKSVVEEALRGLRKVLAAAARYAGQKLDVAITEFAKEFGKWSARAVLGWMLAQQGAIGALVEHVTRWIEKLMPGG